MAGYSEMGSDKLPWYAGRRLARKWRARWPADGLRVISCVMGGLSFGFVMCEALAINPLAIANPVAIDDP
jgi:hypothetical protein